MEKLCHPFLSRHIQQIQENVIIRLFVREIGKFEGKKQRKKKLKRTSEIEIGIRTFSTNSEGF